MVGRCRRPSSFPSENGRDLQIVPTLVDTHVDVRLEVQFATGVVRTWGRPVALSSNERALLFSIARRRQPSTREELLDLVWGDGAVDSAENAFNVALHRLRRRLGGADAIVYGPTGYRLCDEAVVDIAYLERLARALKRDATLGECELESLHRIYRFWHESTTLVSDRYDWLETTSLRARALAAELGIVFGKCALQRGDVVRALEVARDLLSDDRCDEAAAELAISALLRQGNRAEALRIYRRYANDLELELQMRPSLALTARFDESLAG